ncbi:MAG: undecaprenyldiphospho-muramoylpentapeptide beta-N-acetylglucosaminyltransferase [Firmicutes bacterium]|nr:undecaprenyldiphospho-muramoylpentapeptide beta-N-acetylglucosaminyltransferase [Bacillota bacterium]
MPHLALLDNIKTKFDNIYYIGSHFGIEKQIIEKTKIPYFSITTVKYIRKFTLKNFAIPFKLLRGTRKAKKVLKTLAPDIVFSKGGFVSVPVVLAAKKLKIPVVLHESDFSMGLANRICVRHCKKVLTTFEKTAKAVRDGKGVFCGAPIRQKLFFGDETKCKEQLGIKNNLPVLLIIGGSSGARAINEVVRQSLDKLKSYNIIHITGKGNADESVETSNYFQLEFCDNIEDFFAAADLIVSRAGSNAIFEFLALNKPALLIPLSKAASRGDQILNARYFFKKGYSLVLEQEKLSAKSLVDGIKNLEKQKHVLIFNMERAENKDGTKKIFTEILSSIEK